MTLPIGLGFGGAPDFAFAVCFVGAEALLAGSVGIRITCWHFGHLPDFPDMLSGTFRLCPHWQVTWIGMSTTFKGKY